MNKHPLIRKIYLYLFSLIGLVLITIGTVGLVSLGLKTYIFTKADINYIYPVSKPVTENSKTGEIYAQPSQEEIEKFNQNQRTSQRQKDAAESIAMIIIGIPLYLYHWGVIRREKENA